MRPLSEWHPRPSCVRPTVSPRPPATPKQGHATRQSRGHAATATMRPGAAAPAVRRTFLCACVLTLAVATAPVAGRVAPWSWDHMSTFVHCSNKTGPLSDEIVSLMASSSFTVLEKYMCLFCAPNRTGAEGKVLAAAAQIRAVNPKAPVFFYFAVDYARRWYDLGTWFDEHPHLEVHNADGSLATVQNDDDGNNSWHVFDFAKGEALAKWAGDVANVVRKGDLDGIFIDGYRGVGDRSWPDRLLPLADNATRSSWLHHAWNLTGPTLAAALPPGTIMLPNGDGRTLYGPPPGYNAVSIEFFTPKQIPLLMSLAATKTFVEVHAYIGDDVALFNTTLAAFLVAHGENSYFGAGNTWDTCESWLVPYQIAEYQKPLGAPKHDAKVVNGTKATTYSRAFGSGTHVVLEVPFSAKGSLASCVWWGDGSSTGNAC